MAINIHTCRIWIQLILLLLYRVKCNEGSDEKLRNNYAIQVAATLECNSDVVNRCIEAFKRGMHDTDSPSNSSINILSLPPQNSANGSINYVYDAVSYENISMFVVIGKQSTINMHHLIASHTNTPIIGYATGKEKPSFKSTVPLYTSLQPTREMLAHVMLTLLEQNGWNHICLLLQHSYSRDSFSQSISRHTVQNETWHVNIFDNFKMSDTNEKLHQKLTKIDERECRVFIMHTSASLAKRLFQNMKKRYILDVGAVWLLTDTAYSSASNVEHYPIGAIAFKFSPVREQLLLMESVGYHVKSIDKYYVGLNEKQELKTTLKSDIKEVHRLTLHRAIKEATNDIYTEKTNSTKSLSNLISVKILNLVYNEGVDDKRHWKNIGSFRMGSLKTNAIVWPGNILSGPIGIGKRILRVVTKPAPPFVMENSPYNGTCARSVPCLRVGYLSNKKELDEIFDNYTANHSKPTANFTLRCCQGLSIDLLQSLANDLNFDVQLYIPVDNQHDTRSKSNGAFSLASSSWNSLAQDLSRGYAHMAVAPYSITLTRSKLIDFTHPYFYSGFSLLVSEQKRKTPIYAFMEPFDGWVWISIVASATVVAVVLAIFEWRSPFGLNPWGRKRKTNYTLGSGLNMVYAILFGHTVKTKSPKAWPSKWLQNFWAGASIFIYSSYTANLAAFLAGKNSGVTVSGIYDIRLLEHANQVGLITGTAVEEYVRQVNEQLYMKATRYPSTIPIESIITKLTSGEIDAYLDDTPILAYARETMDVKCKLRLVNNGFGEDAYGIGLPRGSWMKEQLDRKIIEYHEYGYIDELKDRYFRHSHCKSQINDELQGKAEPMKFNQHAGLYMLLVVGIFMCIALMFVEHGTFKWLVPYWRHKPGKSFWKSTSMMFWSQRLHRIITSEELVSPHHSAREMMEVVRNRDFTKLFQKSVKKQEKLVRNRKNLFNVVEQLQWQQLKEELLSQQSSLNEETNNTIDRAPTISIENDISPNIKPNLSPSKQRQCNNKRHIDTLLARNLDSLLLKSLEEKNMLRSSESLCNKDDSDSCSNSENYIDVSKSKGAHTFHNVQVESQLAENCENKDNIVNNNSDETDKVSQSQSTTCINETVIQNVSKECMLPRRYSSVDIPGIKLKNPGQDDMCGQEYNLLPNGMVVRSSPNIRTRCYHESHYKKDSKQNRFKLKRMDDHVDDNFNMQCKQNNEVMSGSRKRCSVPCIRNPTASPPQACNKGCDTSSVETHSNMDRNKKSGAHKFTKEELFMMWKVTERELKKELEIAKNENNELRNRLEELQNMNSN